MVCSVYPLSQKPSVTEISPEEAHLKFPNLSVEAYAIDPKKSNEGRNFVLIGTSLDVVMAKREAERENSLIKKDLELDEKDLRYSYRGLSGSGKVNVLLNGKTIFIASYGYNAPIDSVGGLWALDGKWILELIHTKKHTENNITHTDTLGDILNNGQSLNKAFGYDENFDFQILAGKVFYYYKVEGHIGINYDGQHIQTGFSQIPHYVCCSAAPSNPFHFQDMVSFLANRGEEKSYLEIGVYPYN